MNKEVKAKWVAALRSGEYKQATGRLRSDDGFCCLGVLCDLHSKETGEGWGPAYTYSGESATLDRRVVAWASMPYRLGATVQIDDSVRALTEHNDEGKTFAQIAKAIEEQL